MRRALVGAAILFATRSAYATGVCENTPITYASPNLFSASASAFAARATATWCEERHDGDTIDERRGEVGFIELRDLGGKVIGRLSTAHGDDAAHLQRAVGDFEYIVPGKLTGELKRRGYLPLVASATGCATRIAWTDAADADTVNGFPGATMTVELVRRDRVIAKVDLGLAARSREADGAVRAHFLVGPPRLALWSLSPSCTGPPPGYFGPGDGGDCYPDNQPTVRVLDVKTTPALAACFKP